MKIRVVVTPATPRNSADLIELLESAPWRFSDQLTFEIELAGGGISADGARIRSVAERLAKASARLPSESARIHCELTDCETEGATGSSAPAVMVKTPKPRDVNGSAVRAALPKLLAFPEVAEARPGFERVQRADLFSTVKHVSSPVRISSGGDAGESPRWVAVQFRARGNHAAVLESLRAIACVGAAPVAIATAAAFKHRSDASALIAQLERVVAVTEAAAELGVAAIWIQTAAGDESVTTFGLLRRAEPLTQPFPGGAGERLVFLGETAAEIAGSRYLPAVHGLEAGAALVTDYAREKKLHEVLQTLTKARVITAAHSVNAGGFLVAVCEMLLTGEKPLGARLDVTALGGTRADALLFGEVQGRAIVAVAADRVGTVLSEAHMHGVSAALIGEVTAEPLLELKTRSLATEWRVAELQAARELGRAGPSATESRAPVTNA